MKFISIFRVRGIRLRVILLLYVASGYSDAQSRQELPQCDELKAEVSRAQEHVKERSHFKGIWVSQKCEIRPGPKFLLRRYAFHSDYSFRLIQFHYSDPRCGIPLYSITATGQFVSSSLKTSISWVVPGGIEPDHVLNKISVVPFTEAAAKLISERANKSCPGYIKRKWKPFKKYKLLYYDELLFKKQEQYNDKDGRHLSSLDCTDSLNLNFNELNLVRVEDRRIFKSTLQARSIRDHHHQDNRQLKIRVSYLYLGTESEDANLKPTFYQPPLVLAKIMTNCHFCEAVSKSTDTSPPRIIPEKLLPMDSLNGEWTSLTCEVRPYGLFLKRYFLFVLSGGHWSAQHKYFRDHNCQKSMFELRASGQYFRGRMSVAVLGATEYDFRISDASLTPTDIHFVNNLNSGSCGSSKAKWQLNTTTDLSNIGGCEALGIWIPSVELDLVLVENSDDRGTLLYLGQATSKEKRPTSFQPPLASCRSKNQQNEVDNALYPMPRVQLNIASMNVPFHQFFGILLSLIIIGYS